MYRNWNVIYLAAVFIILFSIPQSAWAISNSLCIGQNMTEPCDGVKKNASNPKEQKIRFAQNNDSMEKRIREAEEKDKANAEAVKNFKFPKLECSLPKIPTEQKTREMTREEILILRKNLEGYRKCVDEAKIKEY
jgi:hypothetical protein